MVYGLRDVGKLLKVGKVRCAILATDIEQIVCPGGYDETLNGIIRLCSHQKVPYVFALSKRQLGNIAHKHSSVTSIGILYNHGAEEQLQALLASAERLRPAYEALIGRKREEIIASNGGGSSSSSGWNDSGGVGMQWKASSASHENSVPTSDQKSHTKSLSCTNADVMGKNGCQTGIPDGDCQSSTDPHSDTTSDLSSSESLGGGGSSSLVGSADSLPSLVEAAGTGGGSVGRRYKASEVQGSIFLDETSGKVPGCLDDDDDDGDQEEVPSDANSAIEGASPNEDDIAIALPGGKNTSTTAAGQSVGSERTQGVSTTSTTKSSSSGGVTVAEAGCSGRGEYEDSKDPSVRSTGSRFIVPASEDCSSSHRDSLPVGVGNLQSKTDADHGNPANGRATSESSSSVSSTGIRQRVDTAETQSACSEKGENREMLSSDSPASLDARVDDCHPTQDMTLATESVSEAVDGHAETRSIATYRSHVEDGSNGSAALLAKRHASSNVHCELVGSGSGHRL
jgi:ribosomal protein L7Ae-like RNA K-turn-binding protein